MWASVSAVYAVLDVLFSGCKNGVSMYKGTAGTDKAAGGGDGKVPSK